MMCAYDGRRYQETITRQKRVSEMGSQQLLLDTYNLKTLILRLHNIGPVSGDYPTRGSPAPQSFTKIVTSKVGQIEIILKLVATPEDFLVERFRVMWPDGQASDLQMLMSLKGMKRQDQQNFLEGLGLGLGSAATVVSTTASAAAISTQASLSMARNAVGNMSNIKWVGAAGAASYSK